MNGTTNDLVTCPACGGSGQQRSTTTGLTLECDTCDGTGRTSRQVYRTWWVAQLDRLESEDLIAIAQQVDGLEPAPPAFDDGGGA